MNHSERRMTHALTDWIVDYAVTHPLKDEAAILAELKLQLATKAEAIFRAKFPPIMGPI
jgi:exoribonuclease II